MRSGDAGASPEPQPGRGPVTFSGDVEMKALLVLVAAASAAVAFPVLAEAPAEADRVALERLAADLDRVWDAGDPATVASLYATDGTLRLDARPIVEGRAAVTAYFRTTIARRAAGARHRTRVERIDMLAPDLALVDARAWIERDGEGGAVEVLARFHNQTVAVREGAGWRFRAVRAQRVAEPPAAW